MAAKKKVAAKKSKKPAAKAPAAAGPVNVITDRAGVTFDPAKHAATADGTPHADSAGKFILKEHHYDGAKKAHYGDTFRHA